MILKKFIKLSFVRFFPPTWLWIKSGFFFFDSVILYFFIDKTISKILMVLSAIYLVQFSITQLCKTFDRKIKNFLGVQQPNKKRKGQGLN